jgi:hypothetical protein
MLLTWYSYSITGIWNCLGNLFTKSFHLLAKFGPCLNVFYILLVSVLFVGWMFKMNSYYKNHKDKGLIQ